jgi:hypothetical protein
MAMPVPLHIAVKTTMLCAQSVALRKGQQAAVHSQRQCGRLQATSLPLLSV